MSEVHLAPIIAAVFTPVAPTPIAPPPLERGSPRSDNCGPKEPINHFGVVDSLERGSPRSDNCGTSRTPSEVDSFPSPLSEVHLAPIIAADDDTPTRCESAVLERGSPRSDNCGTPQSPTPSPSRWPLERGSPRSDNCGAHCGRPGLAFAT